MDIKTLEEKLSVLDEQIQNIFEEIGYEKRFEIPTLEYDRENLSDHMIYKELCSLCCHLDYIHFVLNYLKKPVIHTGEIHVNDNVDYKLNGTILNKNEE